MVVFGEVGVVGMLVGAAWGEPARSLWWRVRGVVAATVTACVVAGVVLVASPVVAVPPRPAPPPGVRSVPVSSVAPKAGEVSQSLRDRWSPSGVSWPAAGVAVVDVGAAKGSRVRAAGLPVWAGAPSTGPLPAAAGASKLRVEVLDQAATTRANVSGVLLRLSWADSPAVAGAASVEVDYSGFRGVFGAAKVLAEPTRFLIT